MFPFQGYCQEIKCIAITYVHIRKLPQNKKTLQLHIFIYVHMKNCQNFRSVLT